MSGCVEIHSSGIHEFLFVQSSKSEEKVKKKRLSRKMWKKGYSIKSFVESKESAICKSL